MTVSSPSPTRWPRRWTWLVVALTVVLVLAVVAVAAFPLLLNTPRARRMILARANKVMAPGKLEVGEFFFHWDRPTEMYGFVIRDAQGKKEVEAFRATWDRSLWQILFDRPRFGTLLLGNAVLETAFVPKPNSSVPMLKILETLKPVIESAKPETDLTIAVQDGRLDLRGPSLPEPVIAGKFDLLVHRLPRPGPITWRVGLDKVPQEAAARLTLEGSYNAWTARDGHPGDLTLRVNGEGFPLHFLTSDTRVRARFAGRFEADRQAGLWNVLQGNATLTDVALNGPRLPGDNKSRRLDRLAASWDVAQRPDAWAIRRVELSGAAGTLKATGTAGDRNLTTRLEGDLDLVTLLALVPGGLPEIEGYRLDRGRLHLTANLARRPGAAGRAANLAQDRARETSAGPL